jgi:hypothetical protein
MVPARLARLLRARYPRIVVLERQTDTAFSVTDSGADLLNVWVSPVFSQAGKYRRFASHIERGTFSGHAHGVAFPPVGVGMAAAT